MKKIIRLRSSSMPMFELVISIGIFSVISVFIMQLFLSADVLEKDAVDLSKATIQAEWIAEGIKGCDTMEEAVNLLHLTVLNDGTYSVRYDSNWNITKNKEKYYATVIPSTDETKYGVTTSVIISVCKIYESNEIEEIYQLPITNYQTR